MRERVASRASRGAVVAGAIALLLATACASVPKTPGERRDERLDALEKRVLELSQQAAVADVELQRLRQEVATLQARLQAPGGASTTRPTKGAALATPPTAPRTAEASPPTSAASRATAPAARPPRPAPAVEESELPEPESAPTVATVTAPRPPATTAKPAPTPPRAVAPAEKPAPVPPPTSAPAPAAAPPAPSSGEGGPVPKDAQVVYDEAYTLYHQGKYDEAEARFEEFLAQAPHTELSDNAEYWIGAARFEKKDYKGALAAFRKTVELYPDANKVPDALFKVGQCLEELKQPKQALEVYDELVKRYPDTAAGTLAAERRAKLRP